jgi:hypothetical protein
MLVRDKRQSPSMLRSPIVSLNKNSPSSGGPLNAPEPHRTMATVKATPLPAVIASSSTPNATNKSVYIMGFAVLF